MHRHSQWLRFQELQDISQLVQQSSLCIQFFCLPEWRFRASLGSQVICIRNSSAVFIWYIFQMQKQSVWGLFAMLGAGTRTGRAEEFASVGSMPWRRNSNTAWYSRRLMYKVCFNVLFFFLWNKFIWLYPLSLFYLCSSSIYNSLIFVLSFLYVTQDTRVLVYNWEFW